MSAACALLLLLLFLLLLLEIRRPNLRFRQTRSGRLKERRFETADQIKRRLKIAAC
jgi:hypothetical protein